MEQEWRKSGGIDRFHVKSLFYQFVHNLLQQLHSQGIDMMKPDLVGQVMKYLQEHYAQALTLESIAANLNYSVPYLASIFKKKTGYSVIDYLIQIRLDIAANLLVETDATLKEIAENVGYKDPYYLSRLFKKHRVLRHYALENKKEKMLYIVLKIALNRPLFGDQYGDILIVIIIINISERKLYICIEVQELHSQQWHYFVLRYYYQHVREVLLI